MGAAYDEHATFMKIYPIKSIIVEKAIIEL